MVALATYLEKHDKTNTNKLQCIQFYVRWKQGNTGLPNDPVDCCNSVGEGVTMSIGGVCTCEVGETVHVKINILTL